MSTSAQDKSFNSDMEGQVEVTLASSALENAMSWIGANMNPDDVFDEKTLKNWAKNFDAEDVCDRSALEYWAEQNGYTKE